LSKPMQNTCRPELFVSLRPFVTGNATDKAAFDSLNRAWLQEYFVVEDIDEALFADPEGLILQKGGHIFIAEMEGRIVGVGALKAMTHREGMWFEMSKFGVEKNLQGAGIGRKLTMHAITLAKEAGADGVAIYSNRSLKPALHLYQSCGFVEVPMNDEDKRLYARGNIKLELSLLRALRT